MATGGSAPTYSAVGISSATNPTIKLINRLSDKVCIIHIGFEGREQALLWVPKLLKVSVPPWHFGFVDHSFRSRNAAVCSCSYDFRHLCDLLI